MRFGYDPYLMAEIKQGDVTTPLRRWAVAMISYVTTLFEAPRPGDEMDMRLLRSPSAGTPPTADELAKLEESRLEFLAGDFIIDPGTARDRDAAHPAAPSR